MNSKSGRHLREILSAFDLEAKRKPKEANSGNFA